MIEITPDDTPERQDDGHSVLLLRRHRYTGTIKLLPVLDPGPGPAGQAHRGGRHPLEEDHQLSKQVAGLDSG